MSAPRVVLSFVLCCSSLAIGCGDKDGDSGGAGDADPVDADGDGYSVDEDCDDTDPDINPFADERCDGVDNDCDGYIDEAGAVDETEWYPDLDGDGYGDRDGAVEGCDEPETGGPWLTQGGDCDDGEERVHPGRDEYCDGYDNDCDDLIDESDAVDAEPWFQDKDGDGFGGDTSTLACDDPALGDEVWTQVDGDCDDTDDAVSPGADEVCNGADDDCDGLVDDEDDDVLPLGFSEWFADGDGDGFGDDLEAVDACDAPEGFVDVGGDCDDGRADVHPGATEQCDDENTDEDCNGLADNADPDASDDAKTDWYVDNDRDGYGSADAEPVRVCDDPTTSSRTYRVSADDCNDGNPNIHPGATERCDGADNDCDDLIDDADTDTDETTMVTWYLDEDGDGFGVEDETALQCDDPSTDDESWARQARDCDDGDAAINPTAAEVCDDADVDENCNGTADDDDSTTSSSSKTTWYRDQDEDGYGDRSTGQSTCEGAPDDDSAWVTTERDCNDDDAAVNPDAEEICDDIDNDCNGGTRSDGLVTWVDRSGHVSDLTASFTGTSSSPVSVLLDEPGVAHLCNARFYTMLEISADVDLVGHGSVILDASYDGTVVSIVDGAEDVSLRDIDIRNGNGSRTDTWIGSDYDNAGGLYCSGASVELASVDFADNQADYGGGLLLEGCALRSTGGSITGGYASEHGGAVFMRDSSWTMEDGNVNGNTGYRGAGAFDVRAGSFLSLVDTPVTDNDTSGVAAAINIDASEVECEGTSTSSPARIWRNESDSASGAAIRGGVSGSDVFTASRCDLGETSNDNAPTDIRWGDSVYTFGDDVSISCEGDLCE
ncbi:MAG: hypothetical protein H6742_11900 [Alphaproteobacteria bacterium]|nr:hypothetical protein [Alphaproteobacteria bacterium]